MKMYACLLKSYFACKVKVGIPKLIVVLLPSPIVNMCYGAIFSFLISDLLIFIVSKAGKMHGMGEDEDLTQLVGIFFHSSPSLPSFLALSQCSLEYQYMKHTSGFTFTITLHGRSGYL